MVWWWYEYRPKQVTILSQWWYCCKTVYSVNIQIMNYRSMHRNVSEFQTPEHSCPSEAETKVQDKTGPVTRQTVTRHFLLKSLAAEFTLTVTVRWHHIGQTAESRGSNVRRFRDGALGPPHEEDCQPEKIGLNSSAVNCERRVQSVQFPDTITILRLLNNAK